MAFKQQRLLAFDRDNYWSSLFFWKSSIESGLKNLLSNVTDRVRVINLSAGYSNSALSPSDELAKKKQRRKEAIDLFQTLDLADKDTLFVQSAGNGQTDAALNGYAASALWNNTDRKSTRLNSSHG